MRLALSPDSTRLACISNTNTLNLLDLKSHRNMVIDDKAASPVAWAPDSRFLAYIREETKGSLELQIIHDTGDIALSVKLPFSQLAAGSQQTISWVPGTDNVILAGGDGTRTDLYLIDQGQVTPLTTTGDVMGFAVSRDGEKVRWAMRSRNTHYVLLSLYDLAISKRSLTKLDFPDVVPAINPHPRRSVDSVLAVSFSPDLEQLAFVTRGGPGMANNGVALYVTDSHANRVSLVGKGFAAPDAMKPAQTLDQNQPPAIPVAVSRQRSTVQPGDDLKLTFPVTLPIFSSDSRALCALRKDGDRNYLVVYTLDTGRKTIALIR